MKTTLRFTTLEMRDNPYAVLAGELAVPFAPPDTSELVTLAQTDLSGGETLLIDTPIVSPVSLVADENDPRMIDFSYWQAVDHFNGLFGDTFVGPPLPPSLFVGPLQPVYPIVLPPLLLPGDYGIEPLPWNETHPDWPQPNAAAPLPPTP